MSNRKQTAIEFTVYMFQNMPEEKKRSFCNASYRNTYLTSEYTLRDARLTVYKEGWYIEMEGCRSRFAAWAWDNDGELVWGRKPREDKLHYLWGSEFDNCYIYPANSSEMFLIEKNW